MCYKIHTLNELLDIYIFYLRCDFLICRDKKFPLSVTNNMDLAISLSVPAFSLSIVNARSGVSKDPNPLLHQTAAV